MSLQRLAPDFSLFLDDVRHLEVLFPKGLIFRLQLLDNLQVLPFLYLPFAGGSVDLGDF